MLKILELRVTPKGPDVASAGGRSHGVLSLASAASAASALALKEIPAAPDLDAFALINAAP